MKKKIFLTAAIAAVMALSLAGCGVKVTDMAIPETATIEKGESVTLPINFGTDKAPAETPVLLTDDAATAETADADEKLSQAASKLTIEWTSSDESVVTVDENGVVTAVGAGEADITASVKDADISSTTHVKVVILPTDVDAPDTLELYTNGEDSKSLDAKILPEDATEVKLAYVSSDDGVATVDENGLVTAVADGECTITAYIVADAPATAESATQEAVVTSDDEEVTSEATTDDGVSMMPEDLADVDSAFGVVPDGMKAETKVTVSTKVEKVELDQTKGSLKVGNSVTIKATVTPDEATDKTVTWSSSDEKVATVDSNGKVTAVASGNAVITATSESNEDVKANYDVTVTDKATSSSSSSNKGTTSSKGNTSTGSSSWTGGSTSTGRSSSAGSTTTTPVAPSNPTPATPDPAPVQPSNPEPAQPSNPEPAQPSNPDPAPAPDPEPVQPSQPSGGTTDGSGANGGQVIEGGADKSCPPEEHEVGWC